MLNENVIEIKIKIRNYIKIISFGFFNNKIYILF